MINNLIEHVLVVIAHPMIFHLIVIFISKHVADQIYVIHHHVSRIYLMIRISIICRIVSPSRQGKLYRQISSSHRTETTTIGYFIDQIININSYDIEEEKPNTADSINWDRLLYDKDFSNRLASISSILLFLMPLLLVLLL